MCDTKALRALVTRQAWDCKIPPGASVIGRHETGDGVYILRLSAKGEAYLSCEGASFPTWTQRTKLKGVADKWRSLFGAL